MTAALTHNQLTSYLRLYSDAKCWPNSYILDLKKHTMSIKQFGNSESHIYEYYLSKTIKIFVIKCISHIKSNLVLINVHGAKFIVYFGFRIFRVMITSNIKHF